NRQTTEEFSLGSPTLLCKCDSPAKSHRRLFAQCLLLPLIISLVANKKKGLGFRPNPLAAPDSGKPCFYVFALSFALPFVLRGLIIVRITRTTCICSSSVNPSV